jgi:hypothetical protein
MKMRNELFVIKIVNMERFKQIPYILQLLEFYFNSIMRN